MAEQFLATDNLTVAANQYDPFTISAPVDPRLPDGAVPGSRPAHNINPSVASSATSNFVTLASNYGDQTQKSNSISLNLNARPRTAWCSRAASTRPRHSPTRVRSGR